MCRSLLCVIRDMLAYIKSLAVFFFPFQNMGAQWFSGRVLDSRPRGHVHCVLELDTLILA